MNYQGRSLRQHFPRKTHTSLTVLIFEFGRGANVTGQPTSGAQPKHSPQQQLNHTAPFRLL